MNGSNHFMYHFTVSLCNTFFPSDSVNLVEFRDCCQDSKHDVVVISWDLLLQNVAAYVSVYTLSNITNDVFKERSVSCFPGSFSVTTKMIHSCYRKINAVRHVCTLFIFIQIIYNITVPTGEA